MTPSELKYHVQQTGSHFFDRKTMKFFGDTMANYGVKSIIINGIDCWELQRKRPNKHGLKNSAYFDKKTFKQVFVMRIS